MIPIQIFSHRNTRTILLIKRERNFIRRTRHFQTRITKTISSFHFNFNLSRTSCKWNSHFGQKSIRNFCRKKILISRPFAVDIKISLNCICSTRTICRFCLKFKFKITSWTCPATTRCRILTRLFSKCIAYSSILYPQKFIRFVNTCSRPFTS